MPKRHRSKMAVEHRSRRPFDASAIRRCCRFRCHLGPIWATVRSSGLVPFPPYLLGCAATRQETSPCTANRSSTTASRCRPRKPPTPKPQGTRGAAARLPLRRVPLRHPPAGRLFRSGRRPEARRARQPAACPSRLGHEIAGTVEAAGPEAQGVSQGQALRRLSLDRLRQVRAVRARRRAHVQRAARARRHRRRRLCHPRAGAASALSARRRGHRARDRRRADVLGPHRLRRHQEGACPICAPGRC